MECIKETSFTYDINRGEYNRIVLVDYSSEPVVARFTLS